MIPIALSLLVITLQGTNPPASQPPNPNILRWTKLLQEITSKEATRLIFDVDVESQPPTLNYRVARGEEGMLLLSFASKRRWLQKGGVQVFTRAGDTKSPDYTKSTAQRALDWLRGLSTEEASTLARGEGKLSQIPAEVRNHLMRFACSEPGMADVLMDRGSAAGVGLRLMPVVDTVDPRTNQKTTLVLPISLDGIKVPTQPSALDRANAFHNLDQATPGELDFGDGEILKLSEIAAKTRDRLGISVSFDRRCANNTYFVSGSYTRQTFKEAMREASNTMPFEPFERQQTDMSAEISALLGSTLHELADGNVDFKELTGMTGSTDSHNGKEFIAVRETSVAELTKGHPDMKSYFASAGLDPNSQVRIRPGLALIVNAGGVREDTSTVALLNNRPARAYTPNRTAIGIY